MYNLKSSNNKMTLILAGAVLTLGCTLSACGNGDNVLAMGGAGSGGSGATSATTEANSSVSLEGLNGYLLTTSIYAPPCNTEVCTDSVMSVPAYLKYSFSWGNLSASEFSLLNNQWSSITPPHDSIYTDYLILNNWEPTGAVLFLNNNYTAAILSGHYMTQSTVGNYTITDGTGMTYTVSATKSDLSGQSLSETIAPLNYFNPPNMSTQNFPTGSLIYKVKLLSTLPKYEISSGWSFGAFSTWDSFIQKYNSSTTGVAVTVASGSNLYITFDSFSGATVPSTGVVHVKNSNGISQSDGTYIEQSISGQQLLLVNIPTAIGTINQLYAVKDGTIYPGSFIQTGTEYDLNLLNQNAINAIGYPAVPN